MNVCEIPCRYASYICPFGHVATILQASIPFNFYGDSSNFGAATLHRAKVIHRPITKLILILIILSFQRLHWIMSLG